MSGANDKAFLVSLENVLFLAHFSNTSLQDLLQWDMDKLAFWYDHANRLHVKLNPKENYE